MPFLLPVCTRVQCEEQNTSKADTIRQLQNPVRKNPQRSREMKKDWTYNTIFRAGNPNLGCSAVINVSLLPDLLDSSHTLEREIKK